MNKVRNKVLVLFALIVGIVVWFAGNQGRESQNSTHQGSAASNRTGHARMIEALKKIAEDRNNIYLGDAIIGQLRALLAAQQSGGEGELRLRLALGHNELRLGNTSQAIEELLAARNIIPEVEKETRASLYTEVDFQLALAYLRKGETQNCVARHTSQSCIFPIEGNGVYVEQAASKKAIEYLSKLLERNPSDATSRWLINIAYMTIGGYPEMLPKPHLIDPKTFLPEEDFPRFVDIAPRLGLDTFNLCGGAVSDDFDNDSLLDIVTSTWDTKGQIRFFKNIGDGQFADQTTKAGLTGILGGLNIVQADYNNDGHTDIFVMRGAWLKRAGSYPNSLLRNNGNGTFTDVTFDAGLAAVNLPTQTASWGDYDNDGDLDLFVGNEEASSQLFRNNGDETFTDVATHAGVKNFRYTKAVVWGDYNGDNFPDLYLSNWGQENRLYRNDGDGTFTDVAEQLGVTGPEWSFPSWFWDFNNDGFLDLFVSSYTMQKGVDSVAKSIMGIPFEAELARLYQGDGKGGFKEVAKQQNLTKLTMPMGSNFGDLDNDGFLDFYLGTGYPGYDGLMPNIMYRNRGGSGFSDVTTSGGFGHLQKGHGVVFADLDNDGDQDVFEQMGGAFPGDAFGDALYENPGFGNHWIKLKLTGMRSNRSAIGARIHIELIVEGKRRSIYRHVNSGGSFGANPLRQEIGLGAATVIDVLRVYWPTTGLTQTFRGLDVDVCLEIKEGMSHYKHLPLRRITF